MCKELFTERNLIINPLVRKDPLSLFVSPDFTHTGGMGALSYHTTCKNSTAQSISQLLIVRRWKDSPHWIPTKVGVPRGTLLSQVGWLNLIKMLIKATGESFHRES